jgi:hypothetical protein
LGSSCSQSAVDSLFDSLQIGKQAPELSLPGPGLNLAGVFFTSRTPLKKDYQSHA